MRPEGEIRVGKRDTASGLARGISLISLGQWRRADSRAMTGLGVRRGKAAFFSGCKSHPATIAPAGSNRSSHGGDEMAEAFGIACHALVSLDFRCGSNPEVSRCHGNVRSWG